MFLSAMVSFCNARGAVPAQTLPLRRVVGLRRPRSASSPGDRRPPAELQRLVSGPWHTFITYVLRPPGTRLAGPCVLAFSAQCHRHQASSPTGCHHASRGWLRSFIERPSHAFNSTTQKPPAFSCSIRARRPVIQALFGAFALDESHPGNGQAYIARDRRTLSAMAGRAVTGGLAAPTPAFRCPDDERAFDPAAARRYASSCR